MTEIMSCLLTQCYSLLPHMNHLLQLKLFHNPLQNLSNTDDKMLCGAVKSVCYLEEILSMAHIPNYKTSYERGGKKMPPYKTTPHYQGHPHSLVS